jgi:hypothetical protein
VVTKKILAIDPGGTTGIAIVSFSNQTEPVVSHYEEVPDGLKGFIEWYKKSRDSINWDIIVCETFTLRQNVKFPDLSPVYIIGALEAFESPNKIEWQSPAQKHLCDDKRLKIMNMHKPGKGHANDAIRHAIIYLRNKKHLPTLMLGWKPE